jgi:hypothetical protein
MSKVKDQIIAQAYAAELEDEEDDSESESPSKTTADSGIEDALMQAYIKDPTLFDRSNKVRQSTGRKALCDRLKMTHEQLEGWAIMFSRNVHLSILIIMNDRLIICSPRRICSCKTTLSTTI